VRELVEIWRNEAKGLRRYGAEAQATTLEECARQLSAAIETHSLEALTLEDAAKESGYSYSAIQKMVANGELENVGRKGSPRVRRGGLPKKAQCSSSIGLADSILLRRVA
jgi:hypothetical protein